MDPNQSKILELLRDVHLLAIKEVERLNLRITELEIQCPAVEKPADRKSVVNEPPTAAVGIPLQPQRSPNQPEMLNEHQVAEYMQMSVASVRRWRLFGKGPKFVKIGAAVRYRCKDVEAWIESCPGLK